MLEYEISRKSVQWDQRQDRHEEVNSRFTQYY